MITATTTGVSECSEVPLHARRMLAGDAVPPSEPSLRRLDRQPS
jgi:hypothetical protein